MTAEQRSRPIARTRAAAQGLRRSGAIGDRVATVTLPIAFAVVVVIGWAAYVNVSGVSSLSLPSPAEVGERLIANIPLLLQNAWPTLQSVFLGYLLAVVLGIGVAALINASKIAEKALVPWLIVSQMIPLPAIAPLFVLWTGFDIRPRLMLIALVCFFPIAVNMIDGLRTVDPALVDVLRTMRATRRQRFFMAQFPAALPLTFSGLRIAAAFAVLGAVFGEWVGANSGLGYLIIAFNSQLRTADMLGVVIVLSVIGVALFGLVSLIERLVLPWNSRADTVTKGPR
ncbi:ABC transporter permease [Herbiconiux sp. 11R-BC]|uniref:ABC transporter permease n=1 Tax=Herbiconiux sp. 11R-BC TaxID=3111637 RepID=UPI003C056E66